MGFLIGFPLFIVAPSVIAALIGTRFRSSSTALFVTWLLTPLVATIITVCGTPILRAITPVGNDGTAAIMLPFLGVVTGLIAGIAASAIVRRRLANELATSGTSDLPSGAAAIDRLEGNTGSGS